MGKKWIEKRKRGVFGWLFLLLFWGWNIFMLFAMFAGLSENAQTYQTLTSQAERTGHEIGTGLGVMMLLGTWAVGSVILGLLAYFTRGRREMIEVET